ncbi:CpsL protein [Streptococcus thermophilus TH985]|nr:CpsL protein [Streptococcus thermophilus TH985]
MHSKHRTIKSFIAEFTAILLYQFGSLSTVVGDEKLTSREDRIGPLFMYVQSDEDTFLKVDEVSKTEAQAFNVFN